ncbi:PhzF family phenazine biosynthesis protein [Sphingomonas sp.]|uniref:PhzF family phenazine biosynthesis protein n=1 Tax=Sphingomonas sp. TaxID=28214 RepID=UPI00286BB3F2|nr:PhzF family phenazine biosynthesis protein [Sphingomonas sp.]
MPTLDYVTLDVFTDQAFGGNPLAIIPDARGLDGATMQRIAAEFNYSETTFVLPPPDGSDYLATVRIFTPVEELPFAGHPHVGTAFHVARLDDLFGQPVGDHFRFSEKAGVVDCQIRREGERISASITAPRPLEIGEAVDLAIVAACASLAPDAIVSAHHDPVFVSVGLPFAVAELGSLADLALARPDGSAFVEADQRYHSADDHFPLFLYVRLDGNPFKLRARMFAPLSNIPEDPATGSAAGALGAYLASLAPDSDGELSFTIDQGVEMGRPSRIEVTVEKRRGKPGAVLIGGTCVEMMRGQLSL